MYIHVRTRGFARVKHCLLLVSVVFRSPSAPCRGTVFCSLCGLKRGLETVVCACITGTIPAQRCSEKIKCNAIVSVVDGRFVLKTTWEVAARNLPRIQRLLFLFSFFFGGDTLVLPSRQLASSARAAPPLAGTGRETRMHCHPPGGLDFQEFFFDIFSFSSLGFLFSPLYLLFLTCH